MRKIILLACMCALALCFATPLAAEDNTPDNLVRADTDEGDFFIVSVEVPEVKTDLGDRDVPDNLWKPETGAGDDAFILISPYMGSEADVPDNLVMPETDEGDVFIVSLPEDDMESDVPENLVMPGTTDGDAFVVSMPESEESGAETSSKALGGIVLLGCLGAGIVVHRKSA